MLPPGLYEQVINTALNRELSLISGQSSFLRFYGSRTPGWP